MNLLIRRLDLIALLLLVLRDRGNRHILTWVEDVWRDLRKHGIHAEWMKQAYWSHHKLGGHDLEA